MGKLKDQSTLPPKDAPSKEEMKAQIGEMKSRLFELQNRLYAGHERSVLLIVQGMDASGKDGLINHVFSGINPAGIRVISWKKPTETEADYDFLWRIHQACPPKGMIHVFNRSHYEDIIVPTIFNTLPESKIEKRYDMMNHFEHLLHESGTLLLKFYLHVSEEEQLRRIEERLTMPSKQWKYNAGDMFTIKNRKKFMDAYDVIFDRCSEYAPWHVIPSDKNTYKEYSVLKIIWQEMEKLKLEYPEIKQ